MDIEGNLGCQKCSKNKRKAAKIEGKKEELGMVRKIDEKKRRSRGMVLKT